MKRKRYLDIVIKIVFLIVILLSMVLITLLVRGAKEKSDIIELVPLKSKPISQTVITIEKDPYEIAILSMQKEMDDIATIKDEKEWFLYYLEIIDKYSYIIDPPETIYDYYTEDEIYLIQRTVETECYDQDFESKVNVANVILNRYESDNSGFGCSIEEIITKSNQFAYGRKEISEDTIVAVEYAFSIKDTTDGCIAFRSNKRPDVWYGWEYQFTDEAGHHFYKEVN